MSMIVPQRILIAPSGFKESLDAGTVASAIAAGVRRILPGADLLQLPIPDGGEGTVAAIAASVGGTVHTTMVTGPVGQQVAAGWIMIECDQQRTAILEMASAAGLSLVPTDQRNPTATTTYGVGELIIAALEAGAERIILGCGDSGTSDGGAGALMALGATILDENGKSIGLGGRSLRRAAHLDTTGLHPLLSGVPITLACNIHNVLCGGKGVARVFGPQKGATSKQVAKLEAGLENWAKLLNEQAPHAAGKDLRLGPGTGASGGLGAGLAAVLDARLGSRFEVLLDSGMAGIDLDAAMRTADLVITAEGAIDFQTPHGKVPAEVAARAQRAGVPVLAIAGSLGQGAPSVHEIGISGLASILTVPMPLSLAVERGEQLLIDAAERTMRLVLLGSAVAARSARVA
ncbi:glycerate kinase [Glutamicibacter sp. PS]|uniref:glycerate kinase family protein n=1 Tax=Glutamicibacter sp. PS TaxID=3075634 RepID=UPI002843372D|nr:glycerate kinase [Glutamicibacter sp. PS]MDR4534140.1 glycerate kinase [Glutamicibacter sp. PS]